MKNNKQKDWLNWEIGVCAAGTALYQEIGTDRIYFGGTAEIAGYDMVTVPSLSGFVFDPRDRCEYCRTRRQAGQVYCPQCGAPY